MKKKNIYLLTSLLILTSCNTTGIQEENKKEDQKEVEMNTNDTTAGREEKAEESVVAIPEEVFGTYYGESSTGGQLKLTLNGEEGNVEIHLEHSSSLVSQWNMQVSYEKENEQLIYQNGQYNQREYTSETEYEEKSSYENGEGYFEIGKSQLIWHDEKAEMEDIVFVKEEMVGLSNPWQSFTDIEEAIRFSKVEFDPPIEEALPKGFQLNQYLAMEGVIEADYSDENQFLFVRKSNTSEGKELSGDYTVYSKTWQMNNKGLAITCEGDGEKANLMYFSSGDMHYAIGINLSNEGAGLTKEEIS
ncbi:MAG: hypothetical protein IJ875_01095, partial [Solobacterium sp.]|nr:hypothetical protein [Solobacterium sp.]